MLRYVRLESEPLNIAWTNDGDRILAACVDGQVRIVDSVNFKVTQVLPAIDGWVYAMTVHPDDQTIAVGGSNGQVVVLAIPEEKEQRTNR